MGITPAWAGKRWRSPLRRLNSQDHPRVGGEKAEQTVGENWRKGSPPRGRGKVCSPETKASTLGITPAWAGKSKRGDKTALTKKDHPRVGGEKV